MTRNLKSVACQESKPESEPECGQCRPSESECAMAERLPVPVAITTRIAALARAWHIWNLDPVDKFSCFGIY